MYAVRQTRRIELDTHKRQKGRYLERTVQVHDDRLQDRQMTERTTDKTIELLSGRINDRKIYRQEDQTYNYGLETVGAKNKDDKA